MLNRLICAFFSPHQPVQNEIFFVEVKLCIIESILDYLALN